MNIDARGFLDDGRPAPSRDLLEVARARTGGRVLMSFSGRDSLAAWCYLRDAGFECIPFFCYSVPHLSYDDQMLEYYERVFDTHIIRLPHPHLYELFHVTAWMPPHTAVMIQQCALPRFGFADIEDILAAEHALGPDYLSAVGIRAADNLMRLRLIRQMGTLGVKKRHFYYAVWDWKTADVRGCIRRHGLKLSRSYRHFGSTGDGIDYVFLRYLKDHLPEDYARVLEVFPLAESELFRYEQVR